MTEPEASRAPGARDPERILRLASHMGVLSGLYHGLVHDLKSPLNTLVVNLELLRSSIAERPDVERQNRYVSILHEELMRLNRAVERLLPAAGPSRDERGRFDLRDLLDEVVTLVSTTARHQGVKVEVRSEGAGAILVEGYHDRMREALLCVITNALEAMPRGGALGLGLELGGGNAILTVTDTGPGIPPETAERIFDLYYTTKERHEGLGLYVARSEVESTKGSVEHAPVPAGGSCFTLLLPLAT
jgi:signal transduction histidine kinase